VCGKSDLIKPSAVPTRDATCPHCGSLLWFDDATTETGKGPGELLELENVGDVTVVSFGGKNSLDGQNMQIIGEQLFDLVDNQNKKKILLNFGNIKFLSSAALGKLITLNKKTQMAGGKLVLRNVRKEIKELFAITKLDKLFDLGDDL
jgi:anti-sigma B factor antagonist